MGSVRVLFAGAASAIASIFLVGCNHTSPPLATEVIPLHLVVDRIKGELATYVTRVRDEKATGKACGQPDVDRALDMDFSTVTLVLNTIVAAKGGVGVEAGVIPLGTITASGEAATNVTDVKSQKLTVGLTPLKPGQIITPVEEQPLGIANTLVAVRRELLATNQIEPCLQPDKLSLEIVFGVKRDNSASFGINFIVVSVGGGVSSSREDTHSIEIDAKLVGTPSFL